MITGDKDVILNADRIIFLGQGHFAQAMGNLEKKGLVPVIKECFEKGIPFGADVGDRLKFEDYEFTVI